MASWPPSSGRATSSGWRTRDASPYTRSGRSSGAGAAATPSGPATLASPSTRPTASTRPPATRSSLDVLAQQDVDLRAREEHDRRPEVAGEQEGPRRRSRTCSRSSPRFGRGSHKTGATPSASRRPGESGEQIVPDGYDR